MTTTITENNVVREDGKTDRKYLAVAQELGPRFAARAAQHDSEGSFVAENIEEMRGDKLYSAAVPAEFGGGGASLIEMCEVLRELGRYDGSTALAFSMHCHLLETLKFRVRHNLTPSSEPALRRVAAEELVLVSSGGSDWLDGSGVLTKVEGGYRFSARKVFGSGGPAGDLLLTTGVYQDPDVGPIVMHFAVNLRGEGISIDNDWDTMGMRGTGSNSIDIDNVFIADGGITLTRPRGVWHRFFDIISPMAFALITSVYVGVAESAREIAVETAAKKRNDPNLHGLVGEMETELLTAQCALEEMVKIGGSEFSPSVDISNKIFRLKTVVNGSAIRTVEQAMAVAGGQSYFTQLGLERRFRDVQASRFHPLQKAAQYVFSGRLALGLDPVS